MPCKIKKFIATRFEQGTRKNSQNCRQDSIGHKTRFLSGNPAAFPLGFTNLHFLLHKFLQFSYKQIFFTIIFNVPAVFIICHITKRVWNLIILHHIIEKLLKVLQSFAKHKLKVNFKITYQKLIHLILRRIINNKDLYYIKFHEKYFWHCLTSLSIKIC